MRFYGVAARARRDLRRGSDEALTQISRIRPTMFLRFVYNFASKGARDQEQRHRQPTAETPQRLLHWRRPTYPIFYTQRSTLFR